MNSAPSPDALLPMYAAALGAAWLTTFLLLPAWRAWCLRTNLIDAPGHRKIHSSPVALAGGLAVLTGLALPILMGFLTVELGVWGERLTELFRYGYRERLTGLGILLTGAAAMVLLGWMDDKWELKPSKKLIGQTLVALAVSLAGIRITLFIEQPWLTYVLTVIWIVAVTNTLNLMDNMNGLCAGVGVIASVAFAVTAGIQGQYLVTSFGLLVAGALGGFLPYNFPKAKVFLGDAGSHLTGYSLAVLAVLTTFYGEDNQTPWAVSRPLIILAIPLLDLGWVVAYRRYHGRPIYVGDTNHLSHRLVRRGWSPAQAVAILWALTGACAALSFLVW